MMGGKRRGQERVGARGLGLLSLMLAVVVVSPRKAADAVCYLNGFDEMRPRHPGEQEVRAEASRLMEGRGGPNLVPPPPGTSCQHGPPLAFPRGCCQAKAGGAGAMLQP